MSQFNYILPSGAKFTMTTPAGTTQVEADRIFYSQVAAGALVGVVVGQSVGGNASVATKFALSRLDRGTAGVSDSVILSIVNGLPTVGAIPSLINVPLQNPITPANIASIKSSNFTAPAIGPLSSGQVQGIMAQIANFVNQPANVMTNDKGVGQYGLSCQDLEQAGYVKPGTWAQFIADPSPLTSVMSAPGIFTGQGGINTVTDFLSNPTAQNTAMSNLMSGAYNSLTASGTITPPPIASVQTLIGKIYTQSGLQSLSALSAETGISFSIPNLPSLSDITSGLPSLSGLANGLPSLGGLTSSLPNISGLTSSLANSSVGNLLSSATTNLTTLASGALNDLSTGSLQNISGIATKLTNAVTADVGALVANATKFGTQAATQWASSLPSLGSLTSSLPGITGSSGLPSISGLPSLGSLTSGASATVTSAATDLNVLGKAAQFATGATNPLTSLSNLGNINLPSLSSLTNSLPSLSSLTSGLPGLGGLTSGLPSLTGLTGSLPSLSSLTNSLPNPSSLTGKLPSLDNLSNLSSLSNLLGSNSGSLLGGSSDPLVASTEPAPGFNNTVNRDTVDTATNQIIGSDKIPAPSFEYPDPNSASAKAATDINFAQNQLQNLSGQSENIPDFSI